MDTNIIRIYRINVRLSMVSAKLIILWPLVRSFISKISFETKKDASLSEHATHSFFTDIKGLFMLKRIAK